MQRPKSLEVSAIRLMGAKNDAATDQALQLIERTKTEATDAMNRQRVLELIQTIFIYKFPNLTRSEIETMLGLSELKQTRVYQEAEQAGKEEKQAEMLEITVPLLLEKGMTIEEIAQRYNLTVETIQRFAPQN